MFIPPINLPLEGVPHAKWLEKRSLDQERLNEEFRRFMERSGKEVSTGARQTSNVNVIATAAAATRGLPDGDADALILRTTDNASPFWSGEVIDQAVTYFIGLGTGESYIDAYAGNSNTAVPLPTDVISVDELTMNPIRTPASDERPINLELAVFPSSDLEEFEVWLPSADNDFGNTAPYWALHLINVSDTYRARINIIGTRMMYAGTNIPVMGDHEVWDLDPEFEGGWIIHQSHRGYWANAVTPLTVPADIFGYTGGPLVWDKFFVENVSGRSQMLSFTKSGGLSTGVLPQTYYNDTVSKQYITFARATVGTAPTGASLLVDVKVDGVTEFTTTVAASATTGTATPAAQPWPVNTAVDFFTVDLPPGSYVTVEITQVGSTVAGSDLTVQVWAG